MHSDRVTFVVACLLPALLFGACRATETPPTLPPTTSAPASGSPTASASPGVSGGSATPSAPTSVSPPTSVTPSAGPSGTQAWTLADTGFTSADAISDAAVSDNTIVAVGSTELTSGIVGAAAWHSSDGRAWQPAGLPDAATVAVVSVAATDNGLLAVGFDYAGDVERPAVWLSADGHAWERIESPYLVEGQMTAVAGGPIGNVAVGVGVNFPILFWVSPDGRAWSSGVVVSGIEPDATVNGLTGSDTGYVAFGSDADGRAALWSSANGTAWQPIAGFDGPADSTVNDVLATPDAWLAVGAAYRGDRARTLAWTSPDGLAWQPSPSDLDGEMIDVEQVGAGYLAVGARPEADELRFHAAVWTSADGLAWAQLTDDATFELARMFALLPLAGGIVAIGERALDPAGEELAPAVWMGRGQ